MGKPVVPRGVKHFAHQQDLQAGKGPRLEEKFPQKIPRKLAMGFRHPFFEQNPVKSRTVTCSSAKIWPVGKEGEAEED